MSIAASSLEQTFQIFIICLFSMRTLRKALRYNAPNYLLIGKYINVSIVAKILAHIKTAQISSVGTKLNMIAILS